MEWPWVVLAILIGLTAFFIIYPAYKKYKLKNKVAHAFGRKPMARTGLRQAAAFWDSKTSTEEAGPAFVDDLTWNDLDMDEVFRRVNACQSAVGDVWLYAVLRDPSADTAVLQRREEAWQAFENQPRLRLEAQCLLAQLGRRQEASLDIPVYHPQIMTLRNKPFYLFMAFLPFICLLILPLSVGWGIFISILAMFGNFGLFIGMKAKNQTGFAAAKYLSSCVGCAGKLAKLLRGSHPALAQRLTQATGGFSAFSRSHALLAYNDLVESLGLPNPLAFFLLPLLSYAKIAKWLQQNQKATLALYQALGETDLALSTLSYQHSIESWCLPVFTSDTLLECEDLTHPLLEEAVANNARFTRDILFTGSNASGKSTFIKAVAVNCILAQTIGICTASGFKLRRGLVASSMAVADSIVDGDSYFIAEIKSMRRLMLLADREHFCWFFIDEILKGTNTVERIAASAAVLRYLQGANCLCFAATHDIELTAILNKIYDNYHFRETVAADGVYFDYILHNGPATTRNAILLLQRMDFPTNVTEAANQLVTRFEQQGDWGLLTD